MNRPLLKASSFCKYISWSCTNGGNHSSSNNSIFVRPRYISNLSTSVPEFDTISNGKSYGDLHKFSLSQPDSFWGTLAKSRLQWLKEFTEVSKCDLTNGNISWFGDGEINVSGMNSYLGNRNRTIYQPFQPEYQNINYEFRYFKHAYIHVLYVVNNS